MIKVMLTSIICAVIAMLGFFMLISGVIYPIEYAKSKINNPFLGFIVWAIIVLIIFGVGNYFINKKN